MASPKVLVVDDSTAQAEALVRVMSADYTVAVARDGREAIHSVLTDPPDLVLLDLVLPDMNGLEVLRIIKARAAQSFTPVILVSARSDVASRVEGLRCGADDFLTKPYVDAEILARAAAMLRIKSLQDELAEAKRKLEQLAVTDGLTEIYNRRFFETRLAEEFSRAKRHQEPLSFLMVDLDHFKRVNDTYGHQLGDLVLKRTAKAMLHALRKPDVCARYGGEEFAIILPKTDASGALTVADRVWRMIGAQSYPTSLGDGAAAEGGSEATVLRVTASIGVSCYGPSPDVATAEALVKQADEAVYQAKEQGRNTIRLFR